MAEIKKPKKKPVKKIIIKAPEIPKKLKKRTPFSSQGQEPMDADGLPQ